MTRTVENNLEVLKFLCKGDQKYTRKLLKHADKKLITCLCECVLNVLNGNVPLSKIEKERLKDHKTLLRKLCKKGGSFKKKKNIITQKGSGFLPLLLTPIISALFGQILNS